jgi:hypothetical protein
MLPLDRRYKIVIPPENERMFAKELTHGGHTRRFTIDESVEGWEVRVEQDSTVIRRVQYTDWHRVERALLGLVREVSDLEDGGWTERALSW